MGILLDLIILVIVFGTIWTCYRRGFVQSLWEMGKTLISFVCALLAGHYIGRFIATKYFDKLFTRLFLNKLLQEESSSWIHTMPNALKKLMNICGVDIDRILLDTVDNTATIDTVAESMALPISSVISNLIGYVVAFIVSYFVFWLILMMLNKIAMLPGIKIINKALGACFGCVCAAIFVIIYVLAVRAIAYCGVALGGDGVVMALIDDSYLFKFISNMKLLNLMLNM